jgi:hypothetical protein
MKFLSFYWILFITVTIFSCASENSQSTIDSKDDQSTPTIIEDSEPREAVEYMISKLEQNELSIDEIRDSKWNLFGEQGTWLSTDQGIVDMVPIAMDIDRSKLKITEMDSDDTVYYVYEIHYLETLEQRIEGKQTYFFIGENLIYKSFSEVLIEQIKKVDVK